jgi:outer membrane protein OmpA-like peptidoglycan-associated protein
MMLILIAFGVVWFGGSDISDKLRADLISRFASDVDTDMTTDGVPSDGTTPGYEEKIDRDILPPGPAITGSANPPEPSTPTPTSEAPEPALGAGFLDQGPETAAEEISRPKDIRHAPAEGTTGLEASEGAALSAEPLEPEQTELASQEDSKTATEADVIQRLESRFRDIPVEVRWADDLSFVADLGDSVQFDHGSTTIDRRARAVLARIASILSDADTIQVTVIGHTDSSGTDAINQSLSARRAASVARFLARNGVPEARLASEGRGQSELKVSPEQEETLGPWVNRRIELSVSKIRGNLP